MSHPIAVIDFETTGISPGQGARATEVAIVLLEGGVVVDRFQSLMKTGAWIPPFITQLADVPAPQPFACTVLLSRRLYPQAPSHKLGVLVDYHGLPRTGQAHRALADAEMAAALLARMQHDLRTQWRVAQPDHSLLMALQRCARPAVGKLLAQHTASE